MACKKKKKKEEVKNSSFLGQEPFQNEIQIAFFVFFFLLRGIPFYNLFGKEVIFNLLGKTGSFKRVPWRHFVKLPASPLSLIFPFLPNSSPKMDVGRRPRERAMAKDVGDGEDSRVF